MRSNRAPNTPGSDDIEAIVVTQPEIDAIADGEIGGDRGKLDRTIRQRHERYAALAEVSDPMLDGLGDREAAIGVEEGHVVPSFTEQFGELGVGRADTAVAEWTQEFAADDADPERARG